MKLPSGRCFDTPLSKKLLQRGIDVFLIVDTHADKAILVLQTVAEDRKQRARRTAVTRRAFFANLAVTKQVARRDQLVSESHCLFVVGVVVVAVGKVKWINVPIRRAVAMLDDVKRKLISRRNDRTSRLALREELFHTDLLGFGVV